MVALTFQTNVQGLDRTASVRDAVQRMTDEEVGAVLVFEGTSPVGIFTERDLLRRVVGPGLDPDTTSLDQVMSPEVLTIPAQTRLDEALQLMQHAKVRHLPIAKDGEIVGVVSLSDLAHLANHESRTLFSYITGRYPG